MRITTEPTPQAAELVRRIAAADRGAEPEFVALHERGLRAFLHHLCRNPVLAADLCQETLRRTLERIRAGEVQAPERVASFVLGLARNVYLEELRRANRRATEVLAADAPLPDPRPGPLARALQAEDVKVVRQLLAELRPQRDREVLFRFYLAEEPKEKICADLGLSGVHFNRVLYRARERFRALLVEHGRGPAAVRGWGGILAWLGSLPGGVP